MFMAHTLLFLIQICLFCMPPKEKHNEIALCVAITLQRVIGLQI